jgi:hypothetical protein
MICVLNKVVKDFYTALLGIRLNTPTPSKIEEKSYQKSKYSFAECNFTTIWTNYICIMGCIPNMDEK